MMKGPVVKVTGDGLGASVAAASLARLGLQVVIPEMERPIHGPFLTLNEKTLWVVRDLFGRVVMDEIGKSSIPICRRFISWADARLDLAPEHSLIVAPQALATALRGSRRAGEGVHDLEVRARGRSANTGKPCGQIYAFVWDSIGVSSVNIDWCATISVRQAWVNIAPAHRGEITAQVICVRPSLELAREAASEALARIGFDRVQIDGAPVQAARCVAPRLGSPWLDDHTSMGDELLAIDPVSGDSIGHTVRSAAWFAGLLQNNSVSDVTRKRIFNTRIMAAFKDHLRHCGRYYTAISHPPAWAHHVTALRTKVVSERDG